MTAGYDPMDEFASLAAQLETPASKVPDRRLAIQPPPASDVTEPAARPPIAAEPVQDSIPSEPAPAPAPSPALASPPRPSQGRTRRSSSTSRWSTQAAEQTKGVNGFVPKALIDRLTAYRLDVETSGARVVVSSVVNEALEELPLEPRRLATELDKFATVLNVGRRRADSEWLEETSFGTRLRVSVDRHVALLIRGFHGQYGVRLAREDLYALALARYLDSVGA